MLLVLLIWTTIFFVLFSFGDTLIYCYNKFSKSSEDYSITDTFVLGLCAVLIPLQALSLFFPSNQYTLLLFVILSFLYWLINKGQRKAILRKMTDVYVSLSALQKIFIAISIVMMMVSFLIPSSSYDADYYHFQNIKWNEQYAVVPGLGNFEDRFGFNSNYLLVSALFTFSFLFSGEAYIMLQSLLFCVIFTGVFIQLFRSQYDIKYIIILSALIIVYLLCRSMLKTSDTDIIPILCLFYFFIRVVLNPESITSKVLFPVTLLAALITYKFSTIFFSTFSLYIFVVLIKKKDYKKIIFLSITSLLIISFWCIRNVIITGYLVYPVYYIDIFSFDWKMPMTILMLQQEHIRAWGYYVFDECFKVAPIGTKAGINTLFFFITFSIPFFLIRKRKKLNKNFMVVAVFSFIAMLLCALNAPDLRFFNGLIFGNVLIVFFMIFNSLKIRFETAGKYIALIFVLCLTIIAKLSLHSQGYAGLLLKPIENTKTYTNVTKYEHGNLIFLLTNDPIRRSFYTILCTSREEGVPFGKNVGGKMQSIETIEARGADLQDGFKTKKEYVDMLNKNINEYISGYYKNKYGITVK